MSCTASSSSAERLLATRLEGDAGAVARDRWAAGIVVRPRPRPRRASCSRAWSCWRPGRARRCSRMRVLSSADRLFASDWKTAYRPSAEMSGSLESSFAPAPPAPGARLTSVVVSATRSRTKMFVTPSSSSVERLSASDTKTTKRPSAESAGPLESRVPRGAARHPRRGLRGSSCPQPRRARRRCGPSRRPRSRGCRRRCRRRRVAVRRDRGGTASSSTGAPPTPVAREIRSTSSLAPGPARAGRPRRRDEREGDDGPAAHAASPGRRPSGCRGAGRRPTGRSPGAGSARWRCARRPGRCAG